jgi:hypothetical protein
MNPPVEPELEDCCRSGCTPCVFDLYAEAVERYEAWLAKQPETNTDRRPREGGGPILPPESGCKIGFPPPRE